MPCAALAFLLHWSPFGLMPGLVTGLFWDFQDRLELAAWVHRLPE